MRVLQMDKQDPSESYRLEEREREREREREGNVLQFWRSSGMADRPAGRSHFAASHARASLDGRVNFKLASETAAAAGERGRRRRPLPKV